jgi:hypothetical protein
MKAIFLASKTFGILFGHLVVQDSMVSVNYGGSFVLRPAFHLQLPAVPFTESRSAPELLRRARADRKIRDWV